MREDEFMKILLYTELSKQLSISGLGKAIEHQKKALEYMKIPYTTNEKEKDYDIAHFNTYFLKSYFLAKKLKKKGIKIVFHAHSTEEDYVDGFVFGHATRKLFKWWIVKNYQLGDVIITPTDYSKHILENYRGLQNKKIYAISNGLQLDFFKPDSCYRSSFRNRYGYQEKDKVIIGIGLYIRRKGIVDFVELAKRMPEYQFIWFGHSPLTVATADVREAVMTKLDNLKFAGYVPQKLIREALGGCDLYLFPTLEETEGIPIIEACAMGTDAIIRDIPVFDHWLEDGVNVYKAKDVDEFEQKIKAFFKGTLPSVSKNAFEIAKMRDIKTVGRSLKAVYESVLKG